MAHDQITTNAKRILAAKFGANGADTRNSAVAERILAARFGSNAETDVRPESAESAKPTVAATTAAAAPPATGKAAVSTPNSTFTTPQAFAFRVVGEEGKASLANLERKFGRAPGNVRVLGANSFIVFSISPEVVPSAIAAEGSIAPGLFLEQEKTYLPPAGIAPMATAWLTNVLSSEK